MIINMKLFEAVDDFFALDIGSTSLNVVQLHKSAIGWSLEKVGTMTVDMKITSSDAPEHKQKLSEMIMNLVSQTGITTKNVVLGIPSNKMFATVVNMPEVPASDLATAVRYQAEQYVPMSLDEAKIDWAVLGKLPTDPTLNEVLLVSVENAYTEARLDMLENIGLNVIALEPDSIAVIRSLVDTSDTSNNIIIRFGDNTTDIIVVSTGAPKLVRALPTGFQTMVRALQQNLNIDEGQATQFVTKFGLSPDKLEGKVMQALENVVEQFMSEVSKSAKFFDGKYPGIPISTVILTDAGLSVPGFAQHITDKTGLSVVSGNPWSRVNVSQADQQKIQDISATFAVCVGLAMRNER
ncbi:type IV pilus assembly protein PilM [Candidatus Saccharibacteria bacterium]|nr:type IV pilus assembly protein PilM [Candidatus Saccharibacteria bacterium]NCU40516.1 type IV pilus assembly protein PilM [Candidatus Saccharibacteria bacterium]